MYFFKKTFIDLVHSNTFSFDFDLTKTVFSSSKMEFVLQSGYIWKNTLSGIVWTMKTNAYAMLFVCLQFEC